MKRSEMQRKLFGAVVACLCSTAVFAAGNELYLVQEPGAISDGATNKYEITSGTFKTEFYSGSSNAKTTVKDADENVHVGWKDYNTSRRGFFIAEY